MVEMRTLKTHKALRSSDPQVESCPVALPVIALPLTSRANRSVIPRGTVDTPEGQMLEIRSPIC